MGEWREMGAPRGGGWHPGWQSVQEEAWKLKTNSLKLLFHWWGQKSLVCNERLMVWDSKWGELWHLWCGRSISILIPLVLFHCCCSLFSVAKSDHRRLGNLEGKEVYGGWQVKGPCISIGWRPSCWWGLFRIPCHARRHVVREALNKSQGQVVFYSR
jgi:hypothetical protein